MSDPFKTHVPGLTSPLNDATDITPDDGTDLALVTRAIYVGQAGDVTVQMLGGGQVTLTGLQAGVLYPIRVSRVMATGTTASDLVGMI